MHSLARWNISLLLTLLLTACTAAPQVNQSVPTSGPPTNQFNLLIATTGPVQLNREHWKVPLPVAVGALLRPTDLLDPQASATVLCTGPEAKQMTALNRIPCPLNRGWFEYDGMRFRSTQRGSPKAIPYIIFPRNTLILDPHPLLRWHATTAITYTVTIKTNKGDIIWQQANVTGASLPYPADAPALQSNIDYLLVVQETDTITRSISTADPQKGLGFRLVSQEGRATLAQQRKRILALPGLDDSAHSLALAVAYATWPGEQGRGLWGESWLLLEQVAQTQDTPAIHLWRGNMLRAVKLPQEAIAAYQQALQQAQNLGDIASEAEVHANLWRITGDESQMEQAIQIYQNLGDQIQADALAAELKP